MRKWHQAPVAKNHMLLPMRRLERHVHCPWSWCFRLQISWRLRRMNIKKKVILLLLLFPLTWFTHVLIIGVMSCGKSLNSKLRALPLRRNCLISSIWPLRKAGERRYSANTGHVMQLNIFATLLLLDLFADMNCV